VLNHRLLNIPDKLPLKRQAEARNVLTKIQYAETREAAERERQAFQALYEGRRRRFFAYRVIGLVLKR